MQQQEIIEPAPAPVITTKIAEYSTTAAALGELRGKYEKVLFPVTTTKGMADAVAARAELRNLRVGLEKLRKSIKEPALERCRLIDAEAKEVTAALTALEDPIDAQIQAETARKAAEKVERERVEAARVAAIRAKIEAIRTIPLGMAGATSDDIKTEMDELAQFDTSADFAEFTDEANSAVLSAIRALNDLYHASKVLEDEASRQAALAEENRLAALEIERQRQELAAQQAEAARVAAEQQAERDRIAAAELAEQQRVATENKRQMEAQQAAINAQRAEMERQQREFNEKLAAQAAEDERRRQALAEAEENEKRVAAMTTEAVIAALDGQDDDTHLALLAEVIQVDDAEIEITKIVATPAHTQRVYVLGPMTGVKDLNFPAFHAEAARLRAMGYEVINPAEINGGADEVVACADMTEAELGAHWIKCMRKDIAQLMTCDAISALPGWENSRGASLEHQIATELNFGVMLPAEQVQ